MIVIGLTKRLIVLYIYVVETYVRCHNILELLYFILILFSLILFFILIYFLDDEESHDHSHMIWCHKPGM